MTKLTTTQQLFVSDLRDRIKQGLPGIDTQNLMSPISNDSPYRTVPDDHNVACVMALLYPYNEQWHIIYIERASIYPKDKHAGQISFPGGKIESQDIDHWHCALREVEEEIGISRSHIHSIGALTELYVFASNFLVFPFLAVIDHKPTFVPQITEVASIISFPLNDLLTNDLVASKDMEVRGHTIPDVPYYQLYQHTLWGATAMMTSEIVSLIKR